MRKLIVFAIAGASVLMAQNPVPRSTYNTTTVPKFLQQVGDGSNVTSTSWQVVPVQGTLVYYTTPTASSIATYFQMTAAIFSPKTTQTSTTVTTGTTTIFNWATNAGVPNLTVIPAGSFNVHLHASVSGTAGTTDQLSAQIWEVNSVGVDIAQIVATENTGNLTTSEADYFFSGATSTPYTMASASSRLVLLLRVTQTGATLRTISVFSGGTADSNLTLPGPTADVTNFVPYTGAISTLDLGAHPVNSAGATFTGDVTMTSSNLMINGGSIRVNNLFGMLNSGDINRAQFITNNAGPLIYRNIADANPSLIVNQNHASSTGDIVDFQAGGVTQLSISKTGALSALNGTTIATSSAADQMLRTTASGVASWTAIPDCTDTTGNHLNYTASTHAVSCGTSTGTASVREFGFVALNSPLSAETIGSVFANRLGFSVTIASVWCQTDVGTIAVQLNKNVSTAILSGALTCTTGGAVSTSFAGGSPNVLADTDTVDFVSSSPASSPTRVSVFVKYQ